MIICLGLLCREWPQISLQLYFTMRRKFCTSPIRLGRACDVLTSQASISVQIVWSICSGPFTGSRAAFQRLIANQHLQNSNLSSRSSERKPISTQTLEANTQNLHQSTIAVPRPARFPELVSSNCSSTSLLNTPKQILLVIIPNLHNFRLSVTFSRKMNGR